MSWTKKGHPVTLLVPAQEKPVFVTEAQKVSVEKIASFLRISIEETVRMGLIELARHPMFDEIFPRKPVLIGRYREEEDL